MTATEEQAYTETRDAEIGQGLRQLVRASGGNSRDHGFHDDWPTSVMDDEQDVRRAIAEKLALIHEEVSEMLGEIRSGRDPLDIYFVDTKGAIGPKGQEYQEQVYDADGRPRLKPEGFLVEGADAIIRIADLTFLVDGEDALVEAQRVKHEYNATRPYKHGRKF